MSKNQKPQQQQDDPHQGIQKERPWWEAPEPVERIDSSGRRVLVFPAASRSQ